MQGKIKVLLFTHLSAFVGGVYIGKSIDAEELAAYRSASSYYDSASSWIKRGLLMLMGGSFVVWVGGTLLFSRGDRGAGDHGKQLKS